MNSSDFVKGNCTVCGDTNVDVRQHANIYLSGSEGSWLCETCEDAVRGILRSISRACAKTKIKCYKNSKKEK